MNATTFTIIAIVLFATENVLLSRNLGTVSPIIALALMHSLTATLSITIVLIGKTTGTEWRLPQGNQWWILIVAGLTFALGDICYIKALGTGSLTTITMIACLLPVVATAINHSIERTLPDRNDIIAWFLAVAAVAIVTFKPFSR